MIFEIPALPLSRLSKPELISANYESSSRHVDHCLRAAQPAWRQQQAAATGLARAFQMLATPALFLEYEEVIGRAEQRAVHGMSPERTRAFLIGLAAIIEPVRVYYQWRPQMQDADDEMVLETALNGHADVIVTHNRRDFIPAVSRFSLRVAGPAEIEREVRK